MTAKLSSHYGLDTQDPDVCDLLLFSKRHCDKWHTYAKDARTLRAVNKLERGNDHFQVSRSTKQFRYRTR